MSSILFFDLKYPFIVILSSTLPFLYINIRLFPPLAKIKSLIEISPTILILSSSDASFITESVEFPISNTNSSAPFPPDIVFSPPDTFTISSPFPAFITNAISKFSAIIVSFPLSELTFNFFMFLGASYPVKYILSEYIVPFTVLPRCGSVIGSLFCIKPVSIKSIIPSSSAIINLNGFLT